MFDIDHILGNKKQPKVKSKVFDLMGFNTRHFAVKDKVTKPQKAILKSNNWMKVWSDSDKDGVINGLDCQPRNKKRHMVFRKPLPGEYTVKMSPREYLTRSGEPNWGYDSERNGQSYYLDNEKDYQHISELQKLLKDPKVEVPLPYTTGKLGPRKWSDERVQQEGNHRAYAAELNGDKEIDVIVPPPESWRTPAITKTFLKKSGLENSDNNYTREWEDRIQNKPFPSSYMGDKTKKAYVEALQEHGAIPKLNSNPAFAARKAVRMIGELDPDGTCAGNCKPISERIASQIPGSKVVKSTFGEDVGGEHRAVVLPDGNIAETQRWQFKGKREENTNNRKVIYTPEEYKKEGFTIHTPNNNDGGKQ